MAFENVWPANCGMYHGLHKNTFKSVRIDLAKTYTLALAAFNKKK